MKYLVILAATLAVCSAHMCLVSPHQRGSEMGINKQGASDCALTTGPCGGRMEDASHIALKKGDKFTVTFQKNLDHFTAATPGYFSIMFGKMGGPAWTELGRVNDSASDPSLSLYMVPITIPESAAKGVNVIQVQYVTKNPQAPPAFYQCADVNIM